MTSTDTLDILETLRAGSPLDIVVLVSGTGTLLQSLINHQDPQKYRITRVVADKQCEAIERARRAGIPTQVVALGADRDQWNAEVAQAVAAGQPDVVVSAGFMRILGPAFLDVFAGRTINTHPALLPAFPGAHAVRDALNYGVKVTGSTVHVIDAGVDTGPIIAQRPVLVQPGDTEDTLHERIKQVERQLIVAVLRGEAGELAIGAETDKEEERVHVTDE